MKRSMVVAIVMAMGLCGFVSQASAEPKQGKSHSVTIKGMTFEPAQLEIAVGDVVVWKNNDERDYNVVAKDGSFKSENLGKGASFQHTFKKPGNFAYVCSYYPRMKAVVVVTGK